MTKHYTVNEIFCSLQGEGVRAGTLNFFIRFSGCNQTCKVETHGFDCDTEFASGRQLSIGDIVNECRRLHSTLEWCVITGGEPGLQLSAQFVEAMHASGFKLAVETNGSVELPAGLDWITVSPKVAEHAIRQKKASEVKYVRGFGQGVPRTVVEADHYLLSPAFNGSQIDEAALAWCMQLIRDNPQWRLSVQQHKNWRVR